MSGGVNNRRTKIEVSAKEGEALSRRDAKV